MLKKESIKAYEDDGIAETDYKKDRRAGKVRCIKINVNPDKPPGVTE